MNGHFETSCRQRHTSSTENAWYRVHWSSNGHSRRLVRDGATPGLAAHKAARCGGGSFGHKNRDQDTDSLVDRRIVECLIGLLDHSHPIVQEGAVIALGRYHDPAVVGALGKRLYPTECKPAEVRKAVVESLRQLRMPDAIPFLKIGLRDPGPEVRMAACQALAQIGSPHDLLALETVLLPFEEAPVRIEAAKALGQIGGYKAQEILEKALDTILDDDDHRELRTTVGDQLARLQRNT